MGGKGSLRKVGSVMEKVSRIRRGIEGKGRRDTYRKEEVGRHENSSWGGNREKYKEVKNRYGAV